MNNIKYIISLGLVLTNTISLHASTILNNDFFNSLRGDWISSKIEINLNAELDKDTHLYAESISQFYKSIQKLDDSIYIRSYMINNFDDSILNAYQLSYNYSFSELSFIEYDEFFKRFLYREYNISFHDFNLSKLTGRISPMDIVPEGLFGNLYYIGQDVPLQEGKSDRFINITLTNGNLNVIAGDIYGGWGGWGKDPYVEDVVFKKSNEENLDKVISESINFYWLYYSSLYKSNDRLLYDDFIEEYKKYLSGGKSYLSEEYEKITNVRRFIESFSGKWIYRDNRRYITNITTVSNHGIASMFNFPIRENFLFRDYVLEFGGIDISYYRVNYMLCDESARKKNPCTKFVILPEIKIDGKKTVKPLIFIFPNINESRIYYIKLNEVIEETKKGFLTTWYLSVYHIDFPKNGTPESKIYWKTEYKEYDNRQMVGKAQKLRWIISDNGRKIKEEILGYDGTWKENFTLKHIE